MEEAGACGEREVSQGGAREAPERPSDGSVGGEDESDARKHKTVVRLAARLVAALALAVALLVCTTLYLFVWPPTGPVEEADAVVLLSGDHGERLPVALRLLDRGVADVLVLAGTPDYPLWLELCENRQTYEVVCLRPQPDSTRAEARAAGRLAVERGWRSLVVVTTTYHVTRSALLFDRCFDGEVRMVAADRSLHWRATLGHIGREWTKVGHAAVLERGC